MTVGMVLGVTTVVVGGTSTCLMTVWNWLFVFVEIQPAARAIPENVETMIASVCQMGFG